MPRPQQQVGAKSQDRLQDRLQDRFQERLEELKSLRDTIRVDLHLANMDLKSEWQRLEEKLTDPASAVEQIKAATLETIERLAVEMRGFRDRLRELREPHVGELMTATVITCHPDDTLATAMTEMWDHDVGWLPVVGDQGRVVGVITDRDGAMAAATRGQHMYEIDVASVMNRNIAACSVKASLDEALALMRARRVRRLVVIEEHGDKIVGVLTLTDLVRAAKRAEGSTAEPRAANIVLVLADIATPAASAPN